MTNLLITGGAGFIGSNLVKYFVEKYSNYKIFNLDNLTYAGNLMNLSDIEDRDNYKFLKGDITDNSFINELFSNYNFQAVIHLAAESHVDKSIDNPIAFAETNVIGTLNLLNACIQKWDNGYKDRLFYHISTDEVYGSLGETGLFLETTPYSPNSPYSASKASSDHFVRAYSETYNLPIKISNCSNNYGPFQFPEKLIPLCINNIINMKPLPVYGDGRYTRDWLYVEDHVKAIDLVFHSGLQNNTYNIGGGNEWRNIDLVKLICSQMDKKLGRASATSENLITFVKDRPGHDLRYAIDSSKIYNQLGWSPSVPFEEGLSKTIDWYLSNTTWLDGVTSGEYRDYYRKQYSK